MRTPILFAFVCVGLAAMPVEAADSGERTYGDPACTDRNADPEKCVLQDGPRTRATAIVEKKADDTGSVTPPAPAGGASFTPPPTVTPSGGTSFTPPPKATTSAGTSFTPPPKATTSTGTSFTSKGGSK